MSEFYEEEDTVINIRPEQYYFGNMMNEQTIAEKIMSKQTDEDCLDKCCFCDCCCKCIDFVFLCPVIVFFMIVIVIIPTYIVYHTS